MRVDLYSYRVFSRTLDERAVRTVMDWASDWLRAFDHQFNVGKSNFTSEAH